MTPTIAGHDYFVPPGRTNYWFAQQGSGGRGPGRVGTAMVGS